MRFILWFIGLSLLALMLLLFWNGPAEEFSPPLQPDPALFYYWLRVPVLLFTESIW